MHERFSERAGTLLTLCIVASTSSCRYALELLPSLPFSLGLRRCHNSAGRMVVTPQYTGASLAAVPSGTKQVFLRFDADSPAMADDARLDAFKVRPGSAHGST